MDFLVISDANDKYNYSASDKEEIITDSASDQEEIIVPEWRIMKRWSKE